MAFADELAADYGNRVTVWSTSERRGRPDLSEWVDPLADVYACGSPEIVDELEHLVAPRRLHIERFQPKIRTSTTAGQSFSVVAARTGTTLTVGPESTILETLESSGISVLASCRRGVCGSCEIGVLDGLPEHLDSVMGDEDKDDAGVVYPCVSRSRTPVLTLDI